MIFKKKNVYNLFYSLLLFLIPFNIYAYSDYIVASGENIGIRLFSDGILIVGTYEVESDDPAKEAGLKIGDIIESVDNKKVKSIDDMVNIINESRLSEINITYRRDDKSYETTLKLTKSGNTIKTGLYVKDSITGVGTLTYIDPNTKIFGALGHEIADSTTKEILNINSGTIFPSIVTGITKSNDGNPGEKNATFNSNEIDGKVLENTNKGIFGDYISDIDDSKLYKVAKYSEIKTGKAKIKTVLDGDEVGEYDINIISVSNTDDKIKNIIFEITDKEVIGKTNGIVQGMSGSPIIQGEYIIGAVTHVVIDDPLKGYGILITNMLEEGEN